MKARLLDGKRIADELLDRLAARVGARVQAGKVRPGLAVVLVGRGIRSIRSLQGAGKSPLGERSAFEFDCTTLSMKLEESY